MGAQRVDSERPPHTLRDHTKIIYAKIGVHSRRELTTALSGRY